MTTRLTIEKDAFVESFGHRPLAVGHALTEHPLLELEALAQLAERLPAQRVEHNYADVPKVVDPSQLRQSADAAGDVARGIETNGCWMILRNIELDEDYRNLLNEGLDEVVPLVEATEGSMIRREGFIFLSAPGSMTPCHTDPEHNFLLQVRGTKEINIGEFPDPRSEQLALEQALGGEHSNLSWEPVNPVAFDLAPGDGVYVQPHAPHWVENGPRPSISLSITFRTPASQDEINVHALNARLRRLGLSPVAPGQHPFLDRSKARCATAMGRVRRSLSRRAAELTR